MRVFLYSIAIIIAVFTFSCDTSSSAFDDAIPDEFTVDITVVPEEGGQVSPPGGKFVDGNRLELEAEPAEGFVFNRWEGDFNSTSNPATIIVRRDMAITALFNHVEFQIVINTVGEGIVTQEVVSEEVTTTEENTVQSSLSSKKKQLDTAQQDTSGSIRVDDNRSKESVNLRHSLGQTDSIENEDQIIEYKGRAEVNHVTQTVRLTAEPEEGWIFDRWEGDLTGSENPETIVVDENKEVTAIFVQENAEGFTLVVDIVGDGSVDIDPDNESYEENEEVTLTATSEAGWDFIRWEGDLTGNENPAVISMDSDKFITSIFEEEGSPEIAVQTQPSETVAGNPINPAPSIELLDGNGEPLSGVNVSVSLNKSSFATGSETQSSTNQNGIASFENLVIRNADSGYRLTFSADTDGVSDLQSDLFDVVGSAGDPDNTNATVPDGVAGELTVIEIIVRDQFGNRVQDASSELSLEVVSGDNQGASFETISDEGNGVYISGYTPTSSGSDEIEILLAGAAISGSPFSSSVITSSVSSANSSVTADPTELQVGNSSVLTITLRDNLDNPVTGMEDDIQISGLGDASAGTITEDGSTGVYTSDISSTNAGSITLAVVAESVTLAQNPEITFLAGDADEIAILSGNNQTGTVTQQLSDPFKVSVTDQFGNPVEGQNVTFEITNTPPLAVGQSLSEETTTTNSDGEASTTLTLGTIPGSYEVTASAGGAGNATFTATAELGSVSNLSILLQPSETEAGLVISPAPQIEVTDEGGNPVEGVEVTVSEQGGYLLDSGTLSVTSNESGIAEFDDLVIETTGNYTLVFSTDASGVDDVVTNAFDIMAADGDPANTTANVPDGAAGEPTTILITVQDEFDNPVSGVAGDLSVTVAGENSATPSVTETGTAGEYSTSYTPENAGTDEISIELNGNPIQGSPFESVINVSDISASVSTVTADPIEVVVNNPSVVTVELRDGSNNPIGGLTDSDFNITVSGNGSAGSVSETSTGDYRFNVNNTTAQQVTVTVTAQGVTLDENPAITFEAGDVDIVAIQTQPGETVAGEAIAGPPQVRLLDEFGNRVPGIDVAVSEQGGEEFASGLLTVASNSSGEATFDNLVINRADSYNLVFTASGKTVTSNAFGIVPAASDPAQTTATVINGSAGDVTDITIIVRDSFENRVEGVAGSLSVSVSGENAGAAVEDIEDIGDGVYTTSYTPTSAGEDQITITIDDTGISGSPYTSTVITSEADDVIVEQQPLQTMAGQAIAGPPSVLVTDNLANPVEGVEVNVTIQGGQEFDGGTTSQFTNSSGIAVFDDLVINEENDYRLIFNAIGVTDNAVSDLFDIMPAAASGTVIVSGNNQSGTVTDLLTDQFVVRVEDAFGNRISGHNVEFTIDETPGGATGQTLSTTSTTTDATGEASTQMTLGNRPGTYTVNADAGAAGLVAFTATAEPGAADSFVFNTVASPQTSAQVFGITIEAQDQFENLATGYSGSADLTTTAGSITPSTANFSSGQVTLDVSVSETGTDQTITSTDGTVTGSSNAFDVEAGGVDAGNSSVTAAPVNLQAGNSSTVTIELRDGSNNPVSGLVNTDFTFDLTGSATAGTVSETPTDGTYTADIDNIEAETVTVTVTANGVSLTDTPSITYTAATATSLDIQSGNDQSGIVGQALTDPFVVIVTDEFENPVEGESVDFTISDFPDGATGQSLSAVSVTTDEFGRASTILTLGDAPGTYEVEASSGSLIPVTFSGEAEIGSASQMTVSVQPSETTAGEVITPAPAVTVTDDVGNGIQGVNVTVSEQGGYIFDAGSLTLTTDASGVAAFTDLMIETANTYQLIFNTDVAGVSNESSNPFDVVSSAGDASNTTADVPNGAAGESTSITITVLDSFSNGVTGAADDLSASVTNGPNAGAAFTAIIDNGNGTYSTSYTPETIGTDEVSITLNTIEISGSPYSSDVATSDVSASNSSVTANPTTLQAGSEGEVTVEVRDGSNNPISGLVSGDFNINVSSSGTADIITETATAGTYTFNVTNSVAEEVTVTVNATGTTLEDTPVINFTAADPDLMLITTEPERSVAGEPIEGPPAVRITDEFNNPVPNISVTATEQGGASFSTGSTENLNTDAFGFATFDNLSIESAGQYNLIFSAAGVTNRTSNAFNIDPAGVSGTVSGVSATSPHTADGTDASTVTITLADGFGNEITGLGDAAFSVDVGANASAGTVSETATDGTYEFTVTNTTIETVTVVITADGVPLDEQPTIEFQAGAASEMSITQQPTSAVAGEAIAPAPSVEVTDGTNPVSGVDVTAILSSNDFTAASTVVATTDGSGIAAFSNLIIETAATGYTITFDTEATGVADVTSASFDVDSGDATQINSLSITDSEIALDGTTTVTATILDSNNNPVEGVEVSFSSDQSNRATVEASVLTNGSGQAIATVTGSNGESGGVVITASVSDEDGNVAISDSETVGLTVLAGAADAAESTIVADPATGLNANGSDTSTLTITVRDGSGNLLEGEELFFEITGGTGGTLSDGPWSSDENGEVTATLTSVDANTITVTGYLGADSTGEIVGTADVVFE